MWVLSADYDTAASTITLLSNAPQMGHRGNRIARPDDIYGYVRKQISLMSFKN
jgi:hypothetical protein